MGTAQQSGETDRTSLLARLDSLEAQWDAGRGSAALPEGWERSSVGPVDVVARTERSTRLGAALETRLSELPAWVRDGGLEGGVLVFSGAENGSQVPTGHGEIVAVVRPSRWASSPEGQAEKALDRLMAEVLPEDARAWMAGHSILVPSDRAVVFRQVVTGGLEVTEACRTGRLDACALALGLSDRAPGEAYTSEELRRLIAGTDPGWPPQAAEWSACVQGDDPACGDFLAKKGNRASLLRPLSPAVRHSVLQTALETGGVGALARLRAPVPLHGKPALVARLEAASGMSLQDLLSEWRDRYLTPPVRHASPGIPTLFLALGWLGLAAGYSSRRLRWLDR